MGSIPGMIRILAVDDLKPNHFSATCGPTESRALIQSMIAATPRSVAHLRKVGLTPEVVVTAH
jgi:hypothetical protein